MVTLKNVVKHYDDFTLDVSLNIQEGQITGLVGKNGAGKSTTIKALLDLVSIDSGCIEVFDKNIQQLTSQDKELLGVALSDSGFSNYLTLRNVAKILSRMYSDFQEEQFLRTCQKFGLNESKQLKTFSTGMKAKLRVLIAMSHRAKLLIMDEPTAGMDVQARNEILDMIQQYLIENETSSVLITSHIATDLEEICDDIYLIDNGHIILHEDTDVILSDYAIIKVSDQNYQKLDQSYLLAVKKESFGYCCLTNQKSFYLENYPDIVVENSGIDDLILMLTEVK